MVEKVKKFLAEHSITTHSLVVFTIGIVTVYNQVPQFHDYVLQAYGHFPAGLKNFIEVVIAVVAWYWTKRPVWTAAQRAAMTDKNSNAVGGSQ